MKNTKFRKYIMIMLAVVLALIPAFSAFAETAQETGAEGGRTVIVQEVKLEDAAASAKITRGENEFAAATGVRLAQGDIIRTRGNAILYLSVDSQMVLRMDANSEAVVEKSTFGQKLVVNVKNGHMFYNVAKQTSDNDALEMMSNNVTIAIRGTSGTLAAGNGMVQHMLYDGVVAVSDGHTTRIQQPGELLSVDIGPGYTLETGTAVKNFTLFGLPVSVVEEMKKDAGLAARILASVPVSIGEDGSRQYADAAYFNENIAGVEDVKVFSESLKTVKDDVSYGSSDPKPDPEPEDCPYAHGKELFYIREVLGPGEYNTFFYRYSTTEEKFVLQGASHTSFTGYDYKVGDWVHWDWDPSKELGFCTQHGDSAEIPNMYTVTFDMNGQTVKDPPEAKEVIEGKRVSNPGTNYPVTGYDLEGWYTEPECDYKWDFSTDVVTEDMTLYAHWTPKKLGIAFDLGGGTDGPETFYLTYGEDLPDLKVPRKADSTFDGYFTVDDDRITDGSGSPVDGATELLWSKYTSLTLYAQWN